MVDPVATPTILSQLGSAGGFLSGLGSFGSALGGLFGGGSSSSKRWTNHWNTVAMNMENDRLHNSVKYRVEDAKRAGVHPLVALGMSPSSGGSPGFNVSVGGGRDIGGAMKDMGAGLSRAFGAQQTNLERLQERLLLAQVEGQEIDNAYKASETSRLIRSAQLPPSMPSPAGVPEIGVSNVKPLPASTKYISRTGDVVHYPSQEVADAIEDNMLYQAEHFYGNRIAPFLNKPLDFFYELGNKVGRAANDYKYGRRSRRY